MKFTPEIVAALAVLREHAENDFERHRIDVLERDLTAPPAVEVIDEIHQKFEGVIYTTRDSNHYTKSIPLHRTVFAYYHGEIPNDCVIHHLDENKSNNAIENLKCLTRSQHQALHNNNAPEQKFTCKYCGKIIPFNKRGKKTFCSQKCRDAWYKENAQVLEERKCELCGKTFTAFPWQDWHYCSKSCSAKAGWRKERKKKSQATCPVCGNSFKKHSAKQQTCSRKCAGELRRQKKNSL
ncbi:MAG: HNH endonuclease [Selenomonadaceae bacterium]|nr:HNH endonuclease [Selenomonadaceae bacterium]